MKQIILFLFLSVSLTQSVFSQKDPCTHASSLIAMFKKFHVQPARINDTTTGQIFKSFYKALDVENVFFTNSDIKLFNTYQPMLLSNRYGDSVCSFLQKVTEIYTLRLKTAETLATSLLETTFNYQESDSMFFSREYKQRFAETDSILQNRWKRKLKYTVIESLVSLYDSIDFENIDSSKFNTIETELRAKILKREKRLIQHVLEYPNGTSSFVGEMFLNAIANRFDPHSFYFSIAGKNDFLAALSTESKSFGLILNETPKGEIVVERVIPGSPASRSGLIRQGDIVQQIIKPDGNILDLTFASQQEAMSVINSSAFDKFTFIMRNRNGVRLDVTLQKELLKNESNNTTGYVLEGEHKIAYIALPDFYSSPNPLKPGGLAKDLSKEIKKLKSKKIQGIILDLRFNGGGSIQEAVSLCSMFIEDGPLFMMKFLKEHPQVVYDIFPGTLYDGPIAILVNSMSASASEIFASTMQDYNRAIIIGSPTYGKATAQYNLPLDSTMNVYIPKGEYNEDAFINITMEKIYRNTGKTWQKTGITPDILLPDLLTIMQISESAEPFALETDEVAKRVYLKKASPLPLTELNTNSSKRILSSPLLRIIKHVSDSLSAITDSIRVELIDFRYYEQQRNKQKSLSDSILIIANQLAGTLPYKVTGKYSGKRNTKKNDDKVQVEAAIIEQIKKDAYILEAYHVLDDYIRIKK